MSACRLYLTAIWGGAGRGRQVTSLLFWQVENTANIFPGIFKTHPCYLQVTLIQMRLAFYFTECQ